jgi:hypothetical protein
LLNSIREEEWGGRGIGRREERKWKGKNTKQWQVREAGVEKGRRARSDVNGWAACIKDHLFPFSFSFLLSPSLHGAFK